MTDVTHLKTTFFPSFSIQVRNITTALFWGQVYLGINDNHHFAPEPGMGQYEGKEQ